MLRISCLALGVVCTMSALAAAGSAPSTRRALHAQGAQPAPAGDASARQVPSRLSPADLAEIRALNSTFVRGWLNDDASAVMSVFGTDAMLFPPGSNPVRGLSDIRAYWWPSDGSHTVITSFERHIDEIEGTSDLAFLRGTASLAWTYEKDGKSTSQTSKSTDLLLLARDPSGHWHVIRQMWATLPN